MGAGTGLVVFLLTLLYMRRKAKAMKSKFGQVEIQFPETEGSEPELAVPR
jgi:hypothetical protein